MDKTFAKIQTAFEGIHNYPGAPEEVAFLRDKHRHIFHVIVFIQQFHSNRDLEFIMFKHWLDKTIAKHLVPMKLSKSCEMMAEELAKYIKKRYGKRELRIEISEDGENGAYLEFT